MLVKKPSACIRQQDTCVDASHLFKVLAGAKLITKNHVLHYCTVQGMHYLIKKEYAQSNQSKLYTVQHTQIKNIQTPTEQIVLNIPLSFIQLMSSKTPIDDSSNGSTPCTNCPGQ